jgi:hypothetical protein
MNVHLYPHQQRALEQTKQFNRVAYYLDMGLGKTFVGSEKAVSFPNKILVICQKSKIADWIDHFQKYYSLSVFNLTQKKQLEEYTVVIGKCVGVINYDLVYRRPIFKEMTNFTLMLDESSIIQNETAKRSQFILKMHPTNIILLSGTPTAGKYENLWSQVHLLGWGITKKRYWEHFVDVDWLEVDDSGFKIQVVKGYKNVDRLKRKLREHGAIFMKSSEAFELPEQTEIPIIVPTPKQYKKFMKTSLTTVKGVQTGEDIELVGDTTLTKRLYARMLCGHYNPNKLQAFEDLIFSTNERIVVFYNFNDELSVLWDIALKKTHNLSLVNGKEKDLTCYEECDDSITFIQYQAGAMGLNLQKASQIVYFTLTDKSELFEQSKKRIHRIGQEKPCFYYYLLCQNTVEIDILETLKMRKDYTDALFEKTYKKE